MKNLIPIMAVACFCCCSCKTNKNIGRSTVIKDSTTTSTTKIVELKKTDSTGTSETETAFTSGFEIEFADDVKEKAAEYAGPDTLPAAVQTIVVNGNKITSSRPIKKVRYKENGTIKEKTVSLLKVEEAKLKDSAGTMVVHQVEKKMDKQVQRNWFSLSVVVPLIALLLALASAYKWWLLPLIAARRKKRIQSEINSI